MSFIKRLLANPAVAAAAKAFVLAAAPLVAAAFEADGVTGVTAAVVLAAVVAGLHAAARVLEKKYLGRVI